MSRFHAQALPWTRVGKGAFPLTQFDPTDLPDDEDTDLDEDGPNPLRKQLRQSQKANKALQEQVNAGAAILKENAFLKAGLPDTPQVKFFQEHYSGEATPEAIKAAAAEFGFTPPVDAATQAEVAAIADQSEALSGGVQSMAPDSEEAMLKEFEEALKAGRSGEAVLRKYGRPVASDFR